MATEVDAEWTTGINLRVALPDLEPDRTARVRIPFTLEVGRSPDAFTARTSAENGVLSFGQWFPIVSTEHDVYGLGDPQISFTADDHPPGAHHDERARPRCGRVPGPA